MKDVALLVIDMQNDFLCNGALLEVKGARKHLASLKMFIDTLRAQGIPIIYTRHTYSAKLNPVEHKLFSRVRGTWLKHKSHGWKIHTDISPMKEDIIIDKHRYDAFFGTQLQRILAKKKIKQLIITGTMTNICCESTARSAMYRDYAVLFCSDMTFCSDKRIQENTQNVIRSHFGRVMSAKQLLRFL